MDINTAVRAMLDNIQAHGWNSATGQLYINWRLNSSGQVVGTDYQTSGQTDQQMKVTPPRQDGHTTMRYLLNQYYWRFRNNDSSHNAEIAKTESAVKTWLTPNPSNPRGWVYFDMLLMQRLSGDSYWGGVANALLAGWKNTPAPQKSGENATGNALRTDWQIEIGAAQVHSGDAAGKARIDAAINLNLNSHGVPWDHGQIKLGEQAQIIYTLASIGDPRAQQFLTALDYLLIGNLGAYAYHDDSVSGIDSSKTEPGRSADMLRAAIACNDAVRTAKLLNTVLNHVYVPSIAGVVYEAKPDFTFLTDSAGTAMDWTTTEAMGIAGVALQTAAEQAGGTVTPPPPVVTPPSPPPTTNAALVAQVDALLGETATMTANLTALKVALGG